jgi:transposase
LIVKSSLPLKSVELDFAVDSSGFSTSKLINWYDSRYQGRGPEEHDWIKVHLMVGVKTNIVTAVEIGGRHTHDGAMLPHLLNTTAQNFQMAEVSADKGYSSKKNLALIAYKGAMPYVPFKKDVLLKDEGTLWDKMFHYYSFRREEFEAHYHKRSNVESTFSMLKAKFGGHVRSKTTTAQVNEVLCKVLAHNLCCLIQSMHELGVEVAW